MFVPARSSMTTVAQPESNGVKSAVPDASRPPIGGVVKEWPLNGRECVRISLEQFKGLPLINIRKWYRADDDSIRPTKDGIALQVKHLPQLAEAIDRALVVARERGLLVDFSDDGAHK